MTELSAVLTNVLHTNHWTLAQLAEMVGFSAKTVGRWCNGRASPTPAQRYVIVDRLSEKNKAAAASVAKVAGVNFTAPATTMAAPGTAAKDIAPALAVELLYASEVYEIPPRKLRKAIARILDAAVGKQWSIVDVQNALTTIARDAVPRTRK